MPSGNLSSVEVPRLCRKRSAKGCQFFLRRWGEDWFVVDTCNEIDVADERGKPIDARVLLELFEYDIAKQPGSMGEAFTWGYCLTCRKSQGSQRGDVLVFDEGEAFRDPNDAAYPNRWRYMVITHASDAVTVVRWRL